MYTISLFHCKKKKSLRRETVGRDYDKTHFKLMKYVAVNVLNVPLLYVY